MLRFLRHRCFPPSLSARPRARPPPTRSSPPTPRRSRSPPSTGRSSGSAASSVSRSSQRTADGTVSAVKGTKQSRSYPSIDLGRDADGKLRLAYLRCDTSSSCKALWNDLDGRRATFRGLALPGCTVTTAPSQWRSRIAYGRYCSGSKRNRERTGLYVKNGSRAPVHLPRPKDAVKFRVTQIDSVDLRGTRVAAVVADIYEYSFSQTTAGKDMRSFFAAASEGESARAHAAWRSRARGRTGR